MVGLDGAGGDQHVRALGQGVLGEVFELAHLVAAEGEGGQVVALDVQAAPQLPGEALKLFQRRRCGDQFQAGKAGEGSGEHGGHPGVSGTGRHSSEAGRVRQFTRATFGVGTGTVSGTGWGVF